MSFEFKLPDIGEGVVEGEIVGWLVKEGDDVAEDQPIVEVLTDKATVVIPSPRAGKVSSIPWGEGDIVPVGDTLIVLSGGADAPAAAPTPAPVAAPAAAPAPVAVPAPVAATPVAPTPAPAAHVVAPAVPAAGDRNKVLAAPSTRRLARELGVDITAVSGSGKGGRVTRSDVERAGAPAAPAAVVAAAPVASAKRAAAAPARLPGERLKLRGIRKAQAAAMVQSYYTAPHFTYVDEIDVTALVALRKRLKGKFAEMGANLTYLPFIVKGCVQMLKDHPFLNSSLDEAAQEIVFHGTFNIGIAVATDRGLTVPVVHDADQKSILTLAKDIETQAGKARDLRMTQDDITGGTFTITSLGRIGGILATPILSPGEVAILGVHNIFDRPHWDEKTETWVPRKIMYLSASFDHRVVDGFSGATAMQQLKSLLEDPELLMML
ncbi:MAG: pyruvate dehydrogenase E2 component (dihydrolipoamide acetyltransferase) [Myxococcota bacterium]